MDAEPDLPRVGILYMLALTGKGAVNIVSGKKMLSSSLLNDLTSLCYTSPTRLRHFR